LFFGTPAERFDRRPFEFAAAGLIFPQRLYIMEDIKSRTLMIVNDLGLHARSAAKLAKLAEGAEKGVWILKNGETADATSMLDIMTLACPKGTEITVRIEDEADMDTLERIAVLIRSGFGEDS
jgi:phosphocarrier protein